MFVLLFNPPCTRQHLLSCRATANFLFIYVALNDPRVEIADLHKNTLGRFRGDSFQLRKPVACT